MKLEVVPEGFPRKRNGKTTRKAVAITISRGEGKMGALRTLGLRSVKDEFSAGWPSASCMSPHEDCGLKRGK